jgi:hypothetical protein
MLGPQLLAHTQDALMNQPPPTPPAGWYPDPTGGPGQRYFDGQKWTIMAPPPPPPPSVVINNNNTVGAPSAVFVRSGPNHGLHLVLTLLTCGMWLPIWLLVTIFSGRPVQVTGHQTRSGAAIAAAVLGSLVLLGLIVEHWQVFLGLGVLVGLGYLGYLAYHREMDRRAEQAKIASRADNQHRAFISGDDSSGIYGQYPPMPPPDMPR